MLPHEPRTPQTPKPPALPPAGSAQRDRPSFPHCPNRERAARPPKFTNRANQVKFTRFKNRPNFSKFIRFAKAQPQVRKPPALPQSGARSATAKVHELYASPEVYTIHEPPEFPKVCAIRRSAAPTFPHCLNRERAARPPKFIRFTNLTNFPHRSKFTRFVKLSNLTNFPRCISCAKLCEAPGPRFATFVPCIRFMKFINLREKKK